MIGKEFKVPKENVKDLKVMQAYIDGHRAALNHHSRELRRREQDLWASIEELTPNFDFERWGHSYDSETGT